ncbi:MAG: A/G-specific adenine glycosylase [Verrucomicrobia bacterium]|nr:A/G-specific adenine glycosylase [Verrucomicrobiota bacterium]
MNQVGIDSTAFRKALLKWYRAEGRRLPWRETDDPYAILVSEFMLQQTQVVTAIPYYHRWLERFPTVDALAAASMQDLLALWQGLGLYRRAHNLQRCARMVVEKWGGVFPRSVEELRALPGVGRYTAGAVASFAYNLPAPVVDGNVARVLSRLLNLQEPVDTPVGQAILWDAAERIAQCDQPRLINNALMELGAIVCKARNPACGRCPVRRACRAVDPETLPRKRPQPPTQTRVERYWWFYDGARVLLEQRQASARWAGLWTLPILDADSPAGLTTFVSLRHHIMRFLVDLQLVRGDHASLPEPPGSSQRWQPVAALGELPMPTPHRRVIGLALAAETPGCDLR